MTAGTLNAVANNGITLGTAIANLTATNNVNGDIAITEADSINVLSAVNAGGNIQVVSAGGLMDITTANSFGFFIASTTDNAAVGDNVVVTGSVLANSFVSLIAGDDITLGGASNVRSVNSFVYMKVDAVNVDAAGGTLILLAPYKATPPCNTRWWPKATRATTPSASRSCRSPRSRSWPEPAHLTTPSWSSPMLPSRSMSSPQSSIWWATPASRSPMSITSSSIWSLWAATTGCSCRCPSLSKAFWPISSAPALAGDDSLKINGSTQNDVIRVSSYTGDANYRFQVRGDTGETECLQVFGFIGNDVIENSAPISSLLDGGNGADIITGSDFSVQPATMQPLYDVIFGGADVDQLFGRAGNDFIYADHDYNFGTPVQTLANGDFINGGLGQDVIIALGSDTVQKDPGDTQPDIIVGQNLSLTINDFLFAQFLPPTAANINTQLQAGLNKHCATPIP